MQGKYYNKVNTSRNSLKLKKRLEQMGHTNVEVWWEPVSGGCEMGGYDGGVFFHSDQNELEPLGYSYEEANEYIEDSKLFEVDRDNE